MWTDIWTYSTSKLLSINKKWVLWYIVNNNLKERKADLLGLLDFLFSSKSWNRFIFQTVLFFILTKHLLRPLLFCKKSIWLRFKAQEKNPLTGKTSDYIRSLVTRVSLALHSPLVHQGCLLWFIHHKHTLIQLCWWSSCISIPPESTFWEVATHATVLPGS